MTDDTTKFLYNILMSYFVITINKLQYFEKKCMKIFHHSYTTCQYLAERGSG